MNRLWRQTRNGRRIDFLDPQPAQIVLEDIAFHLAHISRYNGATDFYSVAQHSVLVSRHCPQEAKLTGLFHDAAEAYLGDLHPGLKDLLTEFRSLEARFTDIIMNKFVGINWRVNWSVVKAVDQRMVWTEAHQLFSPIRHDWAETLEESPREPFPIPLDDRRELWNPWRAEHEFMLQYDLFRGDGAIRV